MRATGTKAERERTKDCYHGRIFPVNFLNIEFIPHPKGWASQFLFPIGLSFLPQPQPPRVSDPSLSQWGVHSFIESSILFLGRLKHLAGKCTTRFEKDLNPFLWRYLTGKGWRWNPLKRDQWLIKLPRTGTGNLLTRKESFSQLLRSLGFRSLFCLVFFLLSLLELLLSFPNEYEIPTLGKWSSSLTLINLPL